MKVEFNGEIRRHQLERASFAELKASICSMFPIQAPFVLKYTDEDNDAISLTSDAELSEAVSIAQRCGKMLRISVVVRAAPAAPATPVAKPAPIGVTATPAAPVPAPVPVVPAGPTKHNAICDACQAAIVGVRFKCGNCIDFDLCAACEAQNTKLVADGKKALHESTHVFIKSTQALAAGREVLLPRVLTGEGACKPQVRVCMPMACMFARRAAQAAAALAAQAEAAAANNTVNDDDDEENESDSDSDDEEQQQQQQQQAKQAALAAEQAVEEAQFDSAWFVGGVSREDAEQRVRGAPAGTFVVRRANHGAGYVLTVSEGESEVVHAHIVHLAGRGWTTRLTSQTMPACASVRALLDSLAPMLRFPVPVRAAVAAPVTPVAAVVEETKAVSSQESVDAVAVATAPVLNPMFASQRRQLTNMGFTDETRVNALLERHSGDIVGVVSELIN